MSNKYKVEISENKENSAWDDFLSKQKHTPYQQSSLYGEVEKLYGFSYAQLVIYEDNIIIGGVQISIRSIKGIGLIGIVEQGPVCLNVKSEQKIIIHLRQYVKQKKIVYLVIDTHVNKHVTSDFYKANGFYNHPTYLPPSHFEEAASVIDISVSEEELRSRINKGRRKDIRQGLKSGLVSREGNREDIEVFFKFMLDTCRRRNTKPQPSSIEIFYRLWDVMAAKGWVKVYLTELEGKVACASFNFSFGDTFNEWKWGWSNDFVDRNISSAADWNTVLCAKKDGLRYFDFGQVHAKVAEAFIDGTEFSADLKKHHFFGASIYKLRFGGEVLFFPGTYIYYPNIFKKFVFHNLLGWVYNLIPSKRKTK